MQYMMCRDYERNTRGCYSNELVAQCKVGTHFLFLEYIVFGTNLYIFGNIICNPTDVIRM